MGENRSGVACGRQTSIVRRQAKALRREAAKLDENVEGNFDVQLKNQLENLLEVKEQMQRIVLGHHKEAAEAVSAQLVQGVRTK